MIPHHFQGFCVLGSGSAGNSVWIQSEQTSLLVDAGLSGRELCRRLEGEGGKMSEVSALLLTHEHQDHMRGVKGLLGRGDFEIFSTSQTLARLGDVTEGKGRFTEFVSGEVIEWKGFRIHTFAVPHDAYEPCGFRVEWGGHSLGIFTDMGYVTSEVRMHMVQCREIILESNYDESLLRADIKRPWSIKQRIMARHGHLSNTQAADLVRTLPADGPLRDVVLAHLSSDCNTPQLARAAVEEALIQAGIPHVRVHVAEQHSCCRVDRRLD